MRRTLLPFALIALTACSENGLLTAGPGQDVAGLIDVSPSQLTFGTLRQGEADIQSFVVTNVGTANLLVDDFEPTGSASFALVDPPSDFLLAPDDAIAIDVQFSPMGSDAQIGSILVHSEDPANPEIPVDLLGTGAVPQLQIDPPDYDFLADFVGCGNNVEVHLKNVGDDDLTISAVDYADPDGQLSLESAPALPITLAPGEQTSAWVAWDPTVEASAQGTMRVTSNDPRGVVSATQEAEGVFATTQNDHFDVPVDPPVDILFAIDQSCSMDAHATQLANSFSSLIQGISQVTDGWQIGVATMDDGCFNSGILTANTPNLQSVFANAVTVGDDYSVANTEKLFAIVQSALSHTYSGCNAGFLRSDALLHVVVVSDEYEQSGISPSSFVSTVRSYKSSPSLVKVSGIICSPSGCGHADGSDTYYRDAVSMTGGIRLDVMGTNWGSYASQLAAASLSGLNTYPLSHNPAPSSITVTVNGQQWNSGWHYDSGTNEIVFDTTPPQGASVDVGYGVLVACN